VFGPKPHGYDIKLNKKVKDLAKWSALTYKAKDNAILVVEDLNLDAPKTKEFAQMLNALKVEGKKILFIMPGHNENIYLSLRNIPTVQSTMLTDINTYDIMHADILVITENAAKNIFGRRRS